MKRAHRFLPGIPRIAGLKKFARFLQPAAAVVLLVFLASELSAIGWSNLAPPATPWFYAALVALYFTPPLADFIIYRSLWDIAPSSVSVFLRKRLYNEVLLDYSGEIYLYAWARRTLAPELKAFAVIRDVNVLSGAVSNVATLLIAGAAAAIGFDLLSREDAEWLLLSCAVTGLFTIVVLAFVSKMFTLTRPLILRTSLVHTARLAIVLLLYAGAWSAAMPAVPFTEWLPVLAAQMLLTRLPLLPNRELMMASLAVSLAPMISATAAETASTFATSAAVMLALHGVMYAATALTPARQDSVQPQPVPNA